jgi:hypothetical protein
VRTGRRRADHEPLLRPSPMRPTISRSRSVSASSRGCGRGTRAGRDANSRTTRRVTDGDSSASPSATRRAATKPGGRPTRSGYGSHRGCTTWWATGSRRSICRRRSLRAACAI